MAFQTYLVCCEKQGDLGTMKGVASFIRHLGGLILLATQQGAIIAGFDDALVERVTRYRGVRFIGGVTLDPRGVATRELYEVFSEYLATQARTQME